MVTKYEWHNQGILKTGFIDGGTRIYSSDFDGTWKTHFLERAAEQPGPVEAGRGLLFLSEQRQWAVFHDEGQLGFYRLPADLQKDPDCSIEHGLGARIWGGLFTPSGDRFVAAGSNGVKTWPVEMLTGESGHQVISFGPPEWHFEKYAGSICVSDDSRLIAWADHVGRVYVRDLVRRQNLPTGKLSATIPSGLAFLPRSHQLIAANVMGMVRIRDMEAVESRTEVLFEQLKSEKREWQKVHFALDPEGNRLCLQRGKQISVWDLKSRRQLVTLPPFDDLAWCFSWSSDSRRLAIGYANGNVTVCNLDAINEQLRSFGLDWAE